MPLKLSIKNAGKVYELELGDQDTGLTMKQRIQDVTQIPIARQKILIKGGKINDDDVIASLNLNLSQPIMVLGTTDKNLPSKPVSKPVFLEDLNANQLVKVANNPSGFVNLGNTCYFNASVQALFSLPDIEKQLKKMNGESNSVAHKFSRALRSDFEKMGKRQQKIMPVATLASLREFNQNFAAVDRDGQPKQQDAEEAFSAMVSLLGTSVKVDDYFRLSFKVASKAPALPDSEETITYEDATKLNCHIDIKTNFLRDGLLAGMKDTLEKHSEELGTNTVFELSKTITRLPKYLAVHFLRFFWKREINQKSKILRRVQFPFELDLSEFLDESIKADKAHTRDQIRKIEKENLELIRDFKKQKTAAAESRLTPAEQQEEEELKIKSIKSKYNDELVKVLPEGYDMETATENPSSVYELTAVITHQGASSESGHYQAFVKDQNDLDGDRWWKFNDDKVTPVTREKIEALAGGGESDSALILLYKGLGL